MSCCLHWPVQLLKPSVSVTVANQSKSLIKSGCSVGGRSHGGSSSWGQRSNRWRDDTNPDPCLDLLLVSYWSAGWLLIGQRERRHHHHHHRPCRCQNQAAIFKSVRSYSSLYTVTMATCKKGHADGHLCPLWWRWCRYSNILGQLVIMMKKLLISTDSSVRKRSVAAGLWVGSLFIDNWTIDYKNLMPAGVY